MVVAWLAEAPVAVTVLESLLAGVEDAVAMVKVELPPAVTAAGLSVAVAPAGSPLALRVTVCAEPLTTAVLMVLVALCPWSAVTVPGLALSSEAPAAERPSRREM